jgi:hypothetical protein
LTIARSEHRRRLHTVDWFNYELTDTGRALAENLYSTRDQHILTVLRQTCPLSIVRRIRELHSGQNDTPQFVLGEISYKHEKSIVGEWGFEAFERAREHLLAQLRGTLREDCLLRRVLLKRRYMQSAFPDKVIFLMRYPFKAPRTGDQTIRMPVAKCTGYMAGI